MNLQIAIPHFPITTSPPRVGVSIYLPIIVQQSRGSGSNRLGRMKNKDKRERGDDVEQSTGHLFRDQIMFMYHR